MEDFTRNEMKKVGEKRIKEFIEKIEKCIEHEDYEYGLEFCDISNNYINSLIIIDVFDIYEQEHYGYKVKQLQDKIETIVFLKEREEKEINLLTDLKDCFNLRKRTNKLIQEEINKIYRGVSKKDIERIDAKLELAYHQDLITFGELCQYIEDINHRFLIARESE